MKFVVRFIVTVLAVLVSAIYAWVAILIATFSRIFGGTPTVPALFFLPAIVAPLLFVGFFLAWHTGRSAKTIFAELAFFFLFIAAGVGLLILVRDGLHAAWWIWLAAIIAFSEALHSLYRLIR